VTASPRRPGAFVTWCRLLRVPNLFTVPGDAIAGFILASGGRLAPSLVGGVVGVVLLYAGGLLLNDYFDRAKDARERPERPIPSGAAWAGTVLAVGLLVLAAGVGVVYAVGGNVPGVVAGLLALAVLAYDGGLKHVPWLGPLVMGSCRGGSVLVGAALAGGLGATAPIAVAAIACVYTAAVTVLAAREASGARLKGSAYVPVYVLILAAVAMLVAAPPEWATAIVALFLLACAGLRIVVAADKVQRVLIAVPVYIGVAVRVMVFTQAAWCLWRVPERFEDFLALAISFAVLLVGAEVLSRRFYGS
jgi:hypothetical protein